MNLSQLLALRWLLPPQKGIKWLVVLILFIHFALQLISARFYTYEIPMLAMLLYVLSGCIDLVVAANLLRKAIDEKKQSFMFMGIGMSLLGTTFILVGFGVSGLFGLANSVNQDLGMYLLILGMGMAALFFALSPVHGRLRSGNHLLLVAMVLLILFVVGLYQLHPLLPTLYENGLPTLFRQQLLTGVILLFGLGVGRFALQTWKNPPTASTEWYVMGMIILTLVTLDFLLSHTQGDSYSWSARFFQILASGAFIQYLWWDEQGK